MTAPVLLWLAGVSMALAFGSVLYLLLGPQPLPLARRRYETEQEQSSLGRAAGGASSLASRLLGAREGALNEALGQAGIRVRAQDFVVLVGSAMVALFAIGLLLRGVLVGLLLLLLGPLLAWLLVRVLTDRRRTRFAGQLDETLQILAGSLRAGYSLPQASSTVATEAAEPTSEEFARIINESRVGRPLVEALEDCASRMKSEDFFWVVQAISINREVGGNLADVLEGVGKTIRERLHLRRQVSSLAAEGKLSAIILCLLPPVIMLIVSIGNPSYMSRFGESLLGIAMLVVSGIMMTIGVLWMRSLVNIKF